MVRFLTICMMVLTFGLAGCTSFKQVTEPNVNIINKSYDGADELIDRLNGSLNPDTPIVVASIADLNDIETSSPLGRVISEHVISRFVERGFTNVSEIRLRQSLFLRERDQAATGEFLLSRDARAVAEARQAGAVVAGTYAVGEYEVLVSLRLIEVQTGNVLTSYDYAIPMNSHVESLIEGDGASPSQGFSIFNSSNSLR